MYNQGARTARVVWLHAHHVAIGPVRRPRHPVGVVSHPDLVRLLEVLMRPPIRCTLQHKAPSRIEGEGKTREGRTWAGTVLYAIFSVRSAHAGLPRVAYIVSRENIVSTLAQYSDLSTVRVSARQKTMSAHVLTLGMDRDLPGARPC